jgi:hypothetical protein
MQALKCEEIYSRRTSPTIILFPAQGFSGLHAAQALSNGQAQGAQAAHFARL